MSEPQYVVVRVVDAGLYLSPREKDLFNHCLNSIYQGRAMDKLPPFNCLVLEPEWPEYGPADEALTKRLELENPKPVEEVKDELSEESKDKPNGPAPPPV